MNEIVAGVDGSPGSVLALRWALEEAAHRGLPVRAVYAYPTATETMVAARTPPPPAADLRAAAEALLARTVDEALATAGPRAAGVTVRQEATPVRGFAAARMLLSFAKGARLLVVGSRGIGGFIGLLVGSVSRQCVQHAPCPVAVVPPDARIQAAPS